MRHHAAVLAGLACIADRESKGTVAAQPGRRSQRHTAGALPLPENASISSACSASYRCAWLSSQAVMTCLESAGRTGMEHAVGL